MNVNHNAVPPKDQPVYTDVVSALNAVEDPVKRVKCALSIFGVPVLLREFNDWYLDAGLLGNWLASNDVYSIVCSDPSIELAMERQGRDDIQVVRYRGPDFLNCQLAINYTPIVSLIGSGKSPQQVADSLAFKCLTPFAKPMALMDYFGDMVGDVLAEWVDLMHTTCPGDRNPDDLIFGLLGDATNYYRGMSCGDHRYIRENKVCVPSMLLGQRISTGLSARHLHKGESRQALEARMEQLLNETQSVAKLLKSK